MVEVERQASKAQNVNVFMKKAKRYEELITDIYEGENQALLEHVYLEINP